MRADFGPVGDDFGGEPAGGVDFGPLEVKGAFAFVAVNPDEFLAGLGAGGDFEEAFGRRGGFAADFFTEFAEGAGIVFFAGVEMARG